MAENTDNRRRVAAVLVLERGSPSNPEILLVKRARHLNSHAGEVGLPGGMAEPFDQDLWHTALREAQEEVGLVPDSVLLQRSLRHAFTRQGVEVAPGLVIPPIVDGL
ncbi:MAG TPA: CoA pyrophosphatase, partial [Cellvibrionaceae bacterium]|nr:CoA pyrophosphatase [Cellvibrionaceae bacterium]